KANPGHQSGAAEAGQSPARLSLRPPLPARHADLHAADAGHHASERQALDTVPLVWGGSEDRILVMTSGAILDQRATLTRRSALPSPVSTGEGTERRAFSPLLPQRERGRG